MICYSFACQSQLVRATVIRCFFPNETFDIIRLKVKSIYATMTQTD